MIAIQCNDEVSIALSDSLWGVVVASAVGQTVCVSPASLYTKNEANNYMYLKVTIIYRYIFLWLHLVFDTLR